jgi:hypothetical protein
LHVLSTPPAFVLSQDQTLQTKTTQPKGQMEFESEQSDTKPVKTGKKTTTPRKRKTGSPPKAWQNKQTKTTKHTIEFSNNTPG